MKSLFVKALGGLDNQTPEHNVDPSNATIAQYFDPFRAKPGSIAPCFGFKDITITNWNNTFCPQALFELGGREIVLDNIYVRYIEDGVLSDFPEPNRTDIFPSSVYVDTNSYSIGKKDEPNYIEYFNAYLFGIRNEVGETEKHPKRLILAKKYHEPEDYPDNPEYLIYPLKMALEEFPAIMDFDITASVVVGWNDALWQHEWHYFIVIEDYMGNLITKLPENKNESNAYHQYYSNGDSKPPKLAISWDEFGLTVTETLGIKKIHIYRVDYTAEHALTPVEDIQDLYARARWRWTKDIREDMPWSGVITDIDPSSVVLGDNIYPGYDAMKQWMSNANIANDVVGLHNGALWIVRDNEVYFSEYTLSASYGIRPLNFPTDNRWRFEGIGQIAEIQSVNSVLVVFGTEGVSTLTGTYLDNYYEKKVSDIGISKTDTEHLRRYNGRNYIKATTVIDDKVYFLSNDGTPCVYFNGDVAKFSNINIPRKGNNVEYYPPGTYLNRMEPINTYCYRGSWMIANADTIYLYDIRNNVWHEWPEGVWRFYHTLNPYYEDATLDEINPNEYSYFKFIKYDIDNPDTNLYVREYATDGTVPTSIWKTPLIRLDGVKRIAFIKLYWNYNLVYRYEYEDTDPADRTPQSIDAEIDIYLDEKLDAVKTVDFEPTETDNGSYYTSILLNVRAEKFAFRLYGSAMKYLQLTGYELIYEDRGHKRFG